jgi:hypothetical protein
MKRALAAAWLLACALAAATALGADDDEAARSYWQQRSRELRANYEQAVARRDAAVAAYQRMRHHKRGRGEPRTAALAERDAAEQALREAERALAELPEQARRAGALPGWIRDAGEPPAAPD